MKVNKLFTSFFIFGMILTFISSFGATSVIGQSASEEECIGFYQKFQANFRATEVENIRTAIAAGKQYLGKCNHLGQEQITEYIKRAIPELEKKLPGFKEKPPASKNQTDSMPGVGEWRKVDKQYGNPENGTFYKLSRWRFLNEFGLDEKNNLTGGNEIVALALTGQPRDLDSQSYTVVYTGTVFKIDCAKKMFSQFQYIQYSDQGKPTIYPHYDSAWQDFDRYKNSRLKNTYIDACEQANIVFKQISKETKKTIEGKN